MNRQEVLKAVRCCQFARLKIPPPGSLSWFRSRFSIFITSVNLLPTTRSPRLNMSSPDPPKIKLYTNHGCGWSQRVQITLRELKLPYEEVLLDLDQPRPDWFLELNPVCSHPLVHCGSEHGWDASFVHFFAASSMNCQAVFCAWSWGIMDD